MGSWQLAVGSWQLAVGSWQLAVGSWQRPYLPLFFNVYFGPACLRPAFLAGSFDPAHFNLDIFCLYSSQKVVVIFILDKNRYMEPYILSILRVPCKDLLLG